MNLTYYKFLFVTITKRKSIWITWLLYVLVVTSFLIITPLAIKMNPLQLWANTAMPICQSFMGVTAAIFTAVLAIAVFKISNEEGTELIVISKPISRRVIIFTKFFVFLTYCLLANISAVLISIFTIFIPNMETKYYWGLLLSMFIGNLILFGLYGFISALLCVRASKVGVIVCNTIISVVLFAYQIMSVFVFSNTIQSLAKIDKSLTTYQSYILPVRNTTDGTYTERNFVGFLSTTDENKVYDMKVTNWEGVKDFWEKRNAESNPTVAMATDIASQLATTYLSVNVNGYADRQAKRAYNFSNYYSYNLTQPCSEEFYENNSPFNMVYKSMSNFGTIGSYQIYLPSSYTFQAMRSTKSSYLKGNATHRIPIANISGKNELLMEDVYFESDQWVKYKPYFDIMYDNVFKYDITKEDGSSYYSYDLSSKSNSFELNNIWCSGETNLGRFYNLVWACLAGKHGSEDYFGPTNDPLKGVTKESFDINSVSELNKRFLQFKYYCFFKVYEQQRNLMINGIDEEQYESEKADYENLLPIFETMFNQIGITQSDGGKIGSRAFILRAPKSMEPEDEDKILLEPGTQTLNTALLYNLRTSIRKTFNNAGLKPTDAKWLKEAEYGSWAIWTKISSLLTYFINIDDKYLFDSLTLPERNDTYKCEMFILSKDWYPYAYNLAAKKLGTYLPYGQNLELSFFESNNRIQYWYFTIIWGLISLCGYCVSIAVYNKFDIK